MTERRISIDQFRDLAVGLNANGNRIIVRPMTPATTEKPSHAGGTVLAFDRTAVDKLVLVLIDLRKELGDD